MSISTGQPDGFGPAATVAEVGEHRLIAMISERLTQAAAESGPELPDGFAVEVDSGDDAAVLQLGSDRVVVSTDVLVEERHFRVRWSSGIDVGVKVAGANLADIAAMGAQPVALVVALVVPGTTRLDWILDLATGLGQEAGRIGARVVGGDISSGEAISVTATALGQLRAGGKPVTLAGARVGDQVALAGKLGWSAAGLTVLSRGFTSPKIVVDAHRRPTPDYAAAIAAGAAGAHSMTDVSDGLVADLAQIARASNVAVEVELDQLPKSDELVQASAALNVPLTEWLLGGGEDHGFVATFAAEVELPTGFTKVGRVQARQVGSPIVGVIDSNGNPLDLRSYRGYVHY